MSLTQKLKILKNIQPRKKWLEQTKEGFLMQAKKEFEYVRSNNISLNNKYSTSLIFLKLFLKPISALAMVAILFFSGSTFTIQAAKNTTPGDPLYVIKINLEKTQKMLTNDKEKRVGLAINFSKERLKELKKLSYSTTPSTKNDKNIKTATQNLNEGIKEIKVSLNELKEESNSKTTIETAKTVDAQTVKIEKELIQTKKEASPLIKEEIEKVLNSVEETSSHALQTIINEQEITKTDSVIKNEATDIIENKIKQTEEKIEEVKNKAVDLIEASESEILVEIEQGGGEIDQIDQQKIEENMETKKQENAKTQEQKNNETIKQEDIKTLEEIQNSKSKTQNQNENLKTEEKNQENIKIQEAKKQETIKQEDVKIVKTIKQDKNEIIVQQKIKENIEKSQEIIKETNKAEAILKEVKETLKQKDLNKSDLNIIAEKVAVSKKLINIADKVAEKNIKILKQ
jgi:CAP-Gly domain-containing linker protein 1